MHELSSHFFQFERRYRANSETSRPGTCILPHLLGPTSDAGVPRPRKTWACPPTNTRSLLGRASGVGLLRAALRSGPLDRPGAQYALPTRSRVGLGALRIPCGRSGGACLSCLRGADCTRWIDSRVGKASSAWGPSSSLVARTIQGIAPVPGRPSVVSRYSIDINDFT